MDRSRRRLFTAMLVGGQFLVCVLPTLADDAPSANAALKYWPAFYQLPAPNDDLRKKVADATTDLGIVKPVDEELAKVVRHLGFAMRFFHKGSQMPFCDWGLDIEKGGPGTLVPHIHYARRLMRYSLLRARYRFEQGQHLEAVDDAIATILLARHIGSERLFISWIMGYRIESVADFVLAAYLPTMSPKELEVLSAKLDTLPQPTSLGDVILNERKLVDWFIKFLKQADADGAASMLSLTGDRSKQEYRAMLENIGGPEGLSRLATELRPLFEEAAQLSSLPLAEFEKAARERLQPKIDKNFLEKHFFPGVVAGRRIEATSKCRMALLKAAIDVAGRGEAALADHPDPYGEGPFEYEKFDGGFMLRSKLKHVGENPLTLTAGIRKGNQ